MGVGRGPRCGIFGAKGAAVWSCHFAAARRLQPIHPHYGLESARHGSYPKPGGEGWRGAPRLLRITELQPGGTELQFLRGGMAGCRLDHQPLQAVPVWYLLPPGHRPRALKVDYDNNEADRKAGKVELTPLRVRLHGGAPEGSGEY